MTECERGTTGFFVRLSININNILGLNYTRLSRYNLDEHVSAVFHWINKSALCHFVFVQHACPCRVSEQASSLKRLWRCLTWKAYSLQKEIQANGLFVLLPKGLLCKPGGEWWLKQRRQKGETCRMRARTPLQQSRGLKVCYLNHKWKRKCFQDKETLIQFWNINIKTHITWKRNQNHSMVTGKMQHTAKLLLE